MASFRGGSSFTGGMFIANPEVFYTFEPLKICSYNLPGYLSDFFQRTQDFLKVSCLRNLLSCQVRNYWQDLEFLDAGAKFNATRMLWQPRIFGKVIQEAGMSATDTRINTICQSRYKHRVTKVIRLQSIESLVTLMKDGVKVLYVVRDPRGTLNSRRRAPGNEHLGASALEEEAIKECTKHDDNLRFLIKALQHGGDNELNDIIRRQLRILRYDDMAREPVVYARRTYEFLNMTFSAAVQKHMLLNPYVYVWVLPKDFEANTKHLSNHSQHVKEVFMHDWRNELNFEQVDMIQDVCNNMMNLLGITSFQRQSELNDPQLSVISKFPNNLLKGLTITV